MRGKRGGDGRERVPHVCDSEAVSVERRTAEGEPVEETAAASPAPQAADSANSAGGQSPTCAYKTPSHMRNVIKIEHDNVYI